jgi:hypothetical protein
MCSCTIYSLCGAVSSLLRDKHNLKATEYNGPYRIKYIYDFKVQRKGIYLLYSARLSIVSV